MSPATTAAPNGAAVSVVRGVVIVAAGSGTRLGLGTAKALVPVAGRRMLARAIDTVMTLAEPTSVVVVAPPDRMDEVRAIVADAAGPAVGHTIVVPGGTDRHASVVAGLAALPDSVTTVLVHDAARCLTPADQFERVFAAVAATGAGVVPALPVVDTVKRITAAGDSLSAAPAVSAAAAAAAAPGVSAAPSLPAAPGLPAVPGLPAAPGLPRVTATVDRADLVAVQTPQGFPLAALRAAYGRSARSETDDAGVFQAAGGAVHVVPGDPDAFKITTPWDLGRAEAILRGRRAPAAAASPASATRPDGTEPPLPADTTETRVGLGVDVHAFDPEAVCRVGLLEFPDTAGLAGHSDGDAVAHAVCDALLSAAGLGDIGGTFGTADPRYVGATGDVFVRGAVSLLAEHGWTPTSVTVQVIGNRPRIGARRQEMQDALAAVVGAPVSVAGTTTDGLGFTGRGEGLAAIATALVRRDVPRASVPAARADGDEQQIGWSP